MDYSLLFYELNNSGIRYWVCGGLAVNLHGVPRMTADIDLILNLTEENIIKFENAIAKLKYKCSVPVTLKDLADKEKRNNLISSKNLVAISFYNYEKNYVALDIVINFPLQFEDMWNEKIIRKSENTEVYLVSLDHLISLKEFADRIQDKQDIYFLSKIKNEQGGK
ncbi:MAG: hypothetical protein ABIT08_10275 [Bacteroidia bacterium]